MIKFFVRRGVHSPYMLLYDPENNRIVEELLTPGMNFVSTGGHWKSHPVSWLSPDEVLALVQILDRDQARDVLSAWREGALEPLRQAFKVCSDRVSRGWSPPPPELEEMAEIELFGPAK